MIISISAVASSRARRFSRQQPAAQLACSGAWSFGTREEISMQNLPHIYRVVADAELDRDVILSGDGLDPLPSAPPAEFGGPGDKWSPETLLVASVADCFILSFRAIARASKFSWTSLKCEVEGILERNEGVTKFTKFKVRATLSMPQDAKEERANRLLEKAEESCLITNSLTGATHLEIVLSRTSES